MRSKIFAFISIIVLLSLLAACAPAAAPTAAPAAAEKPKLKVIYLVNGTLGDKSFFDSGERGIKKAAAEFGFEATTIEAGVDPAKWQPAIEDASDNEAYDIFIVGSYQVIEYLQNAAAKHPDKKFFIFDSSVDYTGGKYPNVYSVQFKQNEGSYLAGVYAAMMSKTKTIGAVGGQDIPVINDFIVGYKQGAIANGVAADKVIVQYAGGWNDPAKGKEIALAMYQQGADIVFQIAGGTGVGVFQAAQETKKIAIGVDSDQATIIKDTDPEQAKVIYTSMLKNVDNAMYRALKMHLDGTLVYGKAEALGVAEGGVGLAKNDIYESVTPADVKAAIEQAEKDLLAGKIKVDTAFK